MDKLRRVILPLLIVCVVLAAILGTVYGLFFTRAARKERAFASGERLLKENRLKEAQLQFLRTTRYDPNFAMAQYLLGHTSMLIKDYPVAYMALQHAVDLRPKYYESNVDLARVLIQGQHFKEARGFAQAALEVKPGDPAAQELYAYSFMGLGDVETAEKELSSLVEHDPSAFSAAMTLVQLKLRAKNMAGAEQVLKTIAAKHPTADTSLALGNFYASEGHLDDAEKNYKQAMVLGPKDVQPLYALGTFYMVHNRNAEAEQIFAKLSSEHEEDARDRGALGRFHYLTGNKTKGIAELQAVMAKYPEDKYNRDTLLIAMVEDNRSDAAMAVLADVLKKNPQDFTGRLSRGILYFRKEQYENAMVDFREVLHQEPTSPQAHFYLGLAYLQRRERGLAKQEFQDAIKYAPANLIARLSLVQVLLQDNSSEAALEVLKETPRAQSFNYGIRLAKAKAELLKSDMLAAEQDLTKLVDEFPKQSPAYATLGALYSQRKDWKRAQTVLEKALSLDPNDTTAIDNLATVYVSLNQAPAGETQYEKMVAAHPKSSTAAVGLARLRIAQGRDGLAEKGIKDFLATTPNDIPAMKVLAELRYEAKDVAGAEALAKQIIKANPDDPSGYAALATLYVSQQRTGEAMAQYKELLKRYPDDPVAANNLAYMMVQNGGNVDEALALAQRSKEKSSNTPEIADTLGWIYMKKNNIPLALGEFGEALRKDPKNQEIQYHLGLAQWKAGKFTEAQGTLTAATTGKPSYPGVDDARRILGDLETKKR